MSFKNIIYILLVIDTVILAIYSALYSISIEKKNKSKILKNLLCISLIVFLLLNIINFIYMFFIKIFF